MACLVAVPPTAFGNSWITLFDDDPLCPMESRFTTYTFGDFPQKISTCGYGPFWSGITGTLAAPRSKSEAVSVAASYGEKKSSTCSPGLSFTALSPKLFPPSE
jgi:hypothetical protein